MNRRACCNALLGLPLALAGPQQALASERPPRSPRVVSVHGSITEIVYLLKAEDLLVGTDTTSTFPDAARHTTKVGYMRQLSAEGLLSLQPSHVLGTDEAGPPVVLTQLRQANVPLNLIPSTWDLHSLLRKVQDVAQATDRVAAGEALRHNLAARWQQTRERIQQAHALLTQQRHTPPKVLFVMAHGGSAMTAGRGTAAHAMLTLAGARNAMAHIEGYRALTAESVAQARPDLVLTTDESMQASGGIDGFWRHPGLGFTPAARQQRLVHQDAMALLGFGPRLPDVLEALHRQLA